MAHIFKINYKKLKKNGEKLIEKNILKNKNKDIIMGCDLSGKSTGIAIINKDNELLFMDKLYIPGYAKTKTDLRLSTFAVGIQSIINKYEPSIAIVEDIFSINISTHNTLARIHGVFLYLMMMNNIKVYYIHPSSAKAFIKCKTKEAVFKKLTKGYCLNVDFNQCNDGVDALLMALNHLNTKSLKEA